MKSEGTSGGCEQGRGTLRKNEMGTKSQQAPACVSLVTEWVNSAGVLMEEDLLEIEMEVQHVKIQGRNAQIQLYSITLNMLPHACAPRCKHQHPLLFLESPLPLNPGPALQLQ